MLTAEAFVRHRLDERVFADARDPVVTGVSLGSEMPASWASSPGLVSGISGGVTAVRIVGANGRFWKRGGRSLEFAQVLDAVCNCIGKRPSP